MDTPPVTGEHEPEPEQPRRYGRRLFLATVVGGVSSLYWGKAAWDHVTGVVSPVANALGPILPTGGWRIYTISGHMPVFDPATWRLRIGGLVDIYVADPFEMGEHRHPRFGFDAGDEAFSPARHDDVDAAVDTRKRQADRGAVARRHQRDRSFGEARFAQALHQAFMDRAAGAETVGAAAQDHGVA